MSLCLGILGIIDGLGLGLAATWLSKEGGSIPKILSALGYSLTFLSAVSCFL